MKRYSDRVSHEHEAELILNKNRYKGNIENFSENGMYFRAAQINTELDLSLGSVVDLEFQIPRGEVLKLHCKVIWLDNISSDAAKKSMGLEMAETSSMYEEFYKTLFIDDRRIF
jgi:hypothetical protein